MTRVEALTLDLDGTLLDGSPWREVIADTCREIAAALPGLDAARLADTNHEVWERYWPEVEDQWVLGEIDGRTVTTTAWRRTMAACGVDEEPSTQLAVEIYLRNRRAAFRLFDDVRPFFEAVRNRIPMALITNGASDTQREALGAVGIDPEFKVIAVSGELGIAKPDPAIFDMVLDTLGAKPDTAWHVGDSLTTDVAGARAAGMTAVWLNRNGAIRSQADAEPDYEIRSLLELARALDVHRGSLGSIRYDRRP